MARNISHDSSSGVFSLIAMLVSVCLMAFGMLIASMALSTSAVATKRADTVTSIYGLESVAQEFLSELDNAIASGVPVLEAADIACSAVRTIGTPTGGQVAVEASTERGDDGTCRIHLESSGRTIDVTLSINPDGTYEILGWESKASLQEEPKIGRLLGM